jgi:hypothetical protein
VLKKIYWVFVVCPGGTTKKKTKQKIAGKICVPRVS